MWFHTALIAVATLAFSSSVDAQTSSSTSTCGPAPSGSIRPSVASGYRFQVVATGLARPRGLTIDSAGHLLVVEANSGIISAHAFNETSGCLTLTSSKKVMDRSLGLNHGIEMSTDGTILYASTDTYVYAWDYNAQNRSVSNQRTVISNMTGTGHSTRTLLLSRKAPGMMVVGKGSEANIDITAADLATGTSQVKAFNVSDRGREGDRVYNYVVDGMRLGWGLRNEVGLGEHPNTGGIWGVENSGDNIIRDGVDVHQNNPAEELNFLGYVNGTRAANEGANFGYPWCFTAWDVSILPNNANLKVGSQFAISPSSASNNTNRTDEYCAQQIAPRLAFQAHMAPLDIKFNNSGTQAWITFHGSWDRDTPVGNKISLVNFTSGGDPVDPSTSTTAAVDIISNRDVTQCPGNCFRPVAMAIDSRGRIFVSSDSSGEIYLITREASSSGTSSASPTASGAPTSSSAASKASSVRSMFTLSNGLRSHMLWTLFASFLLLVI